VSRSIVTSSSRPTTLTFQEVAVGDVLPDLEIPLTRTLIVSTAIASRDYQDVHHDPELAVERGSQDIFMNILSTNGLVGRYITDWSGPGGVLTDVEIRLGAPNYPGDTMTLTGVVTGKEEPVEGSKESAVASDYGTVEVAVQGANSLGDHVSGTVRLQLPTRSTGTAGESGRAGR
jgi:acyl dehydratase